MEIFVKRNDKVVVDVYAWEKDGEIEASFDEEDTPKSGEASEVQIIKFVFRRPNYADSNTVLSTAKITGEEGIADIMGFQESVIRGLLLEIHQGDQIIKAKPRDVTTLHPNIARAAVAGYLDVVTI